MAFFVIFQSKINFFALGAFKLKFSGYAYVTIQCSVKRNLIIMLSLGSIETDHVISETVL